LGEVGESKPIEFYFHGGGGNSSGLPQLCSQRFTSDHGTSSASGKASAAAMARSFASSSSGSKMDAGFAMTINLSLHRSEIQFSLEGIAKLAKRGF
jgi:hypothetical protein